MFLLLKADRPLSRDQNTAMSYTQQRAYDCPTLDAAVTCAAEDLSREHHRARLIVGYNHTAPELATCALFLEFNLVLIDERHARRA